ncbi:MAG: choice-of-anchor D domain-containing protein [Alphaproteobacteria bacterium]|nr:choice-of-anchor D domain-containing protein [Alphaproteobacteria bacterium]
MMHSHKAGKIIGIALIAFVLAVLPVVSYAQYPGLDAPGTHVSGGSAAGLAPVELQVDGGEIPVGSSAQVVIRFRNDGGQPVETGKINLYPSSNVTAEVSLNQCIGAALPSAAECAVAVSVKGLQAGAWRIELLMLHSGRSRLATATISGTVAASGNSTDKLSSDLEMIPDELDFGSLDVSQTMVQSVIVRNITSSPIDVKNVAITSSSQSGFTVDSDCESLVAGQACIATVTWAPKQKGPSTGVLVVRHTGSTALSSVNLLGEYTPDTVEQADVFPEAVPGRGLLVSSQTEVDFGDSVETASTITVSLVNTGDSPLAIKGIKLSGSDNGLSISSSGCSEGLSLDPIEACPLTISWSPTRIGSLIDDVQILHDGARGVLVLPIRGESTGVVSQDQKAIVLSSTYNDEIESEPQEEAPTKVIGADGVPGESKTQPKSASVPSAPTINASSALDGFKITSFARDRAIVNGPGGSRLIYNREKIVLGGVEWEVEIQTNGIQFIHGKDRILLLFDRSLSSVNRVSGQSGSSSSSSSSSVTTASSQ